MDIKTPDRGDEMKKFEVRIKSPLVIKFIMKAESKNKLAKQIIDIVNKIDKVEMSMWLEEDYKKLSHTGIDGHDVHIGVRQNSPNSVCIKEIE